MKALAPLPALSGAPRSVARTATVPTMKKLLYTAFASVVATTAAAAVAADTIVWLIMVCAWLLRAPRVVARQPGGVLE